MENEITLDRAVKIVQAIEVLAEGVGLSKSVISMNGDRRRSVVLAYGGMYTDRLVVYISAALSHPDEARVHAGMTYRKSASKHRKKLEFVCRQIESTDFESIGE